MSEAISKERILEIWKELEIPELDEEFFKNAKIYPRKIVKHSVLLDQDIYEWLQEQPTGLEMANKLLREHMLAERNSQP